MGRAWGEIHLNSKLHEKLRVVIACLALSGLRGDAAIRLWRRPQLQSGGPEPDRAWTTPVPAGHTFLWRTA